ncbi:olfactory receptor 6N1-like [Menidia menidia]
MKMNFTQVFYFTLTAYVDPGSLRYFYFLVVLAVYAVIVGSNLLLVVVICVNRSLHEPMYMFLCSLFVNELYGSTGLFPFLLVQILSDLHTVSAPLCFSQIFCIYSYGAVELFTLSIMSYDRYLAICHPLHYRRLMTPRKIAVLTAVLWLYPLSSNAFFLGITVPLKLCGNLINKVYCDNFLIVKLSCSDITANNVAGLVNMFTVILGLVVLILYTYVRILRVCFRGSRQTRQKVFSTCTPHLASLVNFSVGALFEVVQSRFDMSGLPNMLRVFLSLYWLAGQPLVSPLLYGLKMSKIRSSCKHLLSGRKI